MFNLDENLHNDDYQVGTISEVGYITNKLTQRLKASLEAKDI